jgi:cytochrome c oxidase subunit IV
MSEHVSTHETTGHVATQEHEHPGEALYIKVALILAVLTGIEVALSYVKIGGSQVMTNGGLLLLATIKFAMVAAYFMHLKFDNPILRRLFLAGLITAIVVYIAYLVTLNVFI